MSADITVPHDTVVLCRKYSVDLVLFTVDGYDQTTF